MAEERERGEFVIPVDFESIPSGYTVIPKGDYSFEVKDCWKGKSEGGKPRIQMMLQVINDCEYKGSQIPTGIMNEETSMWVLRRMVEAVLPPEKVALIKGRKFNTVAFVGKQFDASVTVRSFTTKQGGEGKSNDIGTISRLGSLVGGSTPAVAPAAGGESGSIGW